MKMLRWMLVVASVLLTESFYPVFAKSKKTTMNVASFNIRLNTTKDSTDAWPYRAQMVTDLIQYHEFDVFGVQEALPEQMEYLSQMTEYNHVGRGRDDGEEAGEHSAVFFRKDRFRMLDHGDFWFSETPDIPSKGWDATCCNRICSWVKLKEIASGKQFVFFCAHFDHRGKTARKKSAQMMVDRIKALDKKIPVIFVGDLNCRPDSKAYAILTSYLKDAFVNSQSRPYGPEFTCHSFDWQRPAYQRIDYVFVNEPVEVLKYAVLTDSKDRHYPSDHFPVIAKVRF